MAFLIFLPNLIWEQRNHWVTVTALGEMRDYLRAPFSAVAFWMSTVVLHDSDRITPEGAQTGFASVDIGAEVKVPYAPPWLNGPILLCRHPLVSLQQEWPRLVRFY